MRRFTLKITLLSLLVAMVMPLTAQPLEEQFRRPTGDARPWTLWYWMYGAISDEGVRADLQSMADAGLGGAYLVTIRSSDDKRGIPFQGDSDQLTENWWQRVRTAFHEADRLGLQLGVHICDGFALAGGPWISPEESMQKVVTSEVVVRGGEEQLIALPTPAHYENYYEDIALLAMPMKGVAALPKLALAVRNTVAVQNEKQRATLNPTGGVSSGAACEITCTFPEEVTVHNVEIILGGNNYQAHRLVLSVKEADGNYRLVQPFEPARHGWQNTDFQSTHAITPTTGREFRLTWSPDGSEPGSEDLDAAKWRPNLKIKEICFHGTPRLHQWEGKAGFVWRVARATGSAEVPQEACVQPEEVIDLTAQRTGDQVTVQLPEGAWRILRVGHTSTGHTNATGGAGRGLECDKFSRAAVGKQIDNWFGKIYRTIDPVVARRVLKILYVDSWECGSQNWSANFAAEFKARRGYDLMPWMPLFAGIPMESVERSEQVLRDVRETIAELIHDVFFDVLAEKADVYDCRFTAESVAPTMVSDGMYHYDKVDLPMGEFWLNSPTHDKPNDMLDAISGGRVYGKRIISAEGFTEVRGVWDETPAMLKPLLDRNYALGLNRLVYHVYTHNPWMNRRPGMTLDGIGLFFQRDNTWFRDGAKGLSEYAARCQALLQYGLPVVDLAVFTGEEVPRRSILPDRLVGSLPGLFGAERVESERLRLANEGQPIRVRPVGVSHSANMADPEKWINPLRGYAYDSFNRDALLRLATVKEGRLVLPHGASYKVFVVPAARPMNPETPMSEEVRTKIEELKAGGVIVPEIPYVEEDFAAYGLERDVVAPEEVAWTHRRSEEDDTDVYFIANQQDKKRVVDLSLRVAGRQPEIWNPMTGTIADPTAWSVAEGRTNLQLTLDAHESLFVVFRRAGEPTTAVAKAPQKRIEPLQTTPWWISFDLGVQGKRTERRTELFDWSQESHYELRYHSGTVEYRTTFHYKPRKGERVVLRLGRVCDVAAVTLNGKACGIVWTAPYEVDLTEALRKGENTLRIDVSNTWANALLGAEQHKAPFRGIWTNAPYRRKEQTLLPAGLMGPLELEITK